MLGSSIKTPFNPVLECVLKESVDKFPKTGRQPIRLSAAEGSVARVGADTTGTEKECVDYLTL